jgi:hypothetical protein
MNQPQTLSRNDTDTCPVQSTLLHMGSIEISSPPRQ